MNRLSRAQRVQILSALVEGNSVRSTGRMTGVAKNTIVKLLTDLGQACWEYQGPVAHDLPCERLRCDESWSFCHSKQENLAPGHQGILGYGDV